MFKQNLKILILIFSILAPFISFANANQTNFSYNHIVFFGDSLSDDGNLYLHDDGTLPHSPPYFNGRFSNGPTWAELLTSDKLGMTSENYAVGGATAVLNNPIYGYMPVTLSLEVSDYLLRNMFYSKTNTLFVIWIGSNDYLKGATDVNQTTTDVIQGIKTQIKHLAYYGATNFLVINLPDISKSPWAEQQGISKNLHNLVMLHNEKLKVMLDTLQVNNPNLNIIQVNMFKDFNQLLINPKTFDAKYGVDITNVSTPCWNGGYRYIPPSKEQILSLSNKNLNVGKNQHTLDANQILQIMKDSPDLQEAYMVSQSYANGESACLHPNQHAFWDHIHPTEALHQVIAKIVGDDLNNAQQ